MSNTNNPNKVTRQARISKVITGVQQFFMALPVIVLGGKSYPPATLMALLKAVIDAINQTSSAKAGYEAAVQTERDQIAAIVPILRYMEKFVVVQFGDTPDAAAKLEVFGYEPRKARTTKVAVKAHAVAQAKATRIARGTKGPKQKALIQGTVPATEPAPVASPAPAVKPAS